MDVRTRLEQVTLWAPIVTTLLITPTLSTDPTNLPRLLFVVIFGFIGFFLLLGMKNQILLIKYRKIVIVAIGFVAWTIIATFASKINLTEGVFGVSGRQTGLLAYFAFVALMLCAVIASNEDLLKKVAISLVWIGLISGLYGVVQAFGGDPVDWINPYSPVIGLHGNPNFHASFMGMIGTTAFALSLEKNVKVKSRIGFLALIMLALFNIYKSNSQQGYLVILVGFTVVGYLYVHRSIKLRKLGMIYIVGALIGFLAVTLDILQKSPWHSILYKNSVTYRGDFWRAGWKMTLDHPLVGVGMDGFRDHYRSSRDLITALRPGSDVMNDSAHNLLLDISSGGGLPLLLLYLCVVGLTVSSAVNVIRQRGKSSTAFIALLGTWVAYLAQSIISIGNIGLSIWGWILMGAIIGFDLTSREKIEVKRVDHAYSNLAIGMGLMVGLTLGLPSLIGDATFRDALKSGDVIKIEASVRQWPQSVTRMTYVAELLREGDFSDRSILLAREAVKFNPANYEAWRELYLQPNATESEREKAIKTMRKLDPFNPNLKPL